MAASGKLTLKLNPDQAQNAERLAQQQLFGVEKTSSQLLMTVASRLHERLAASVSAKLASYDAAGQTSKSGTGDIVSPTASHNSDLSGLGNEETRISSPASPEEPEAVSGNASILNAWRGFPRSAPYYLPMISMLAGMVRKNSVSLLLHLMTEWLPQRHVLASGGPGWELTSTVMSLGGSNPNSLHASTASTNTSAGYGANSRADGSSLTSSAALTSSSASAVTEPYSPFSSSPLSLILGEEDSITQSFFSFTSFTSRIRNLKLSDQAQLDLVELVVLQVVADVLSLMLSTLTSTRIGLQTLEKLVQISFTLVRSHQPRALDEDTWKVLQAPVQAQWSVVLGYLGPLLMPIFTTFMTVSFPKLPADSQSILLERMHLPLYRADESNVVAFIMASLPHLMGSSSKSTNLRLIQLDTFDRWLLACDMHEGGPLFDKIKDVFKKLLETPSKNEDIEGSTNKLLATILAHSPSSFRDKHIDIILSKTWLKMCWTSKKRDYLECILRVLRGSFLDYNQPPGTVMFPQETNTGSLPTAVIYAPPGIISSTTISVYRPGGSLASKLGIKPAVLPQALPDANPFNTGNSTKKSHNAGSMFEMRWAKHLTLSPYAQCGFAGDREDRMLQRLITINSALFGQKNPLPRLGEQMDICAEIVVQIVAHHIKFGINSVLTPLARGPVYNRLIALHALKRILDPSSGFMTSAYCFQHGSGMMSGRHMDESIDVHVDESDRKALQALLVELVNESLTFAQRQMKDARKEDPLANFPFQPHAQTCYADVELLHELSSKQQLNTSAASSIKACFERVRQLVMQGGPQTWLARQREVDQHHLLVVDTLSKWTTSSSIPAQFKASDFSSADDTAILGGTTTDSKSGEKSDKADKLAEKLGVAPSTTTIAVPLNSTGSNSSTTSGSSNTSTRKAAWPFSSKRKAATVQPEKYTLADVAREAIGALDLALASVHVLQPGDELFIGNLLLHHDEEIAQSISLQLQQAMLTRANLRPVILKSLCQMATSLITGAWALYAPSQPRSFTANVSANVLHAEPNNVLALLAQVLLFVDLWNLASLLKTKAAAKIGKGENGSPSDSSKSSAASAPPPPSLLDELDALAFICLANPAPMVRHTALSLGQSLETLRETFGLPNRGVAWCIRQVEIPLLQRARFAYLKETSQGVDSKVTVKSDAMPLKIEAAASSHHDAFWPHVLAELSHALVDSPSTYQAVVAARFLITQYTSVWRHIVTSSGVSTDYKNQPLHIDFPVLYKQIHILMFATMSVPLYTTGGVPTTLAMFSKTAGWVPNSTNTIHHGTPTLSPTVMLSQTGGNFRKSQQSMPSPNPVNSTVYPTTSTPPQTTIDDVPTDAAALRHADERLSQVVSGSNNYIASLFKTLTMDDQTLIEAVCFATSYVHWRSTLVVASHAWKWYQSISSKAGLSKKRQKARPFLASLFRRLMRHQTQFQWALRSPSPAWIYFVLPLAELSTGSTPAATAGSHRASQVPGTTPTAAHAAAQAAASLPPLPPIYLHLQSVTSQKPVGMPSHDSMLQIAQQRSTSIEEGPVGPLLLLLPRIFFEFIADMASNMSSEHSKTSSFDAGQYFIDNASLLSRLVTALTDIPMVCTRNGALRQYLSPSQHRDAILSILASGTSASLLSIAASGGGPSGSALSASNSAVPQLVHRTSVASFGTVSSNPASNYDFNSASMFGTLSGASAAAAFSSHHGHSHSSSTSSSREMPNATSSAPSTAPSTPQMGHGRSYSISGPSTGPTNTTPPPIHINWAELTDMLLTWAPVGKSSSTRSTMDQADLGKLVTRIKNSSRREERKSHASFFLNNVSSAALSALSCLAQSGLSVPSSVVDKREVASKVLLDWVLPADRGHGLRSLRWLLASHLEVLLPVYIDRALARDRSGSSSTPTTASSEAASHSKDSAMFIHAIYDQFLEDAANAPPEDGITHSTRVFFDRHFQLQKERLRYEKSALKKEDKEFTKVIISRAGQLIFLVLLNLSHASALIRTRSFELLYRLGPIAFGHSHSLADYDLAKRFQDLRDAFISRMEGISRDRALEVSALVSQSCHRYTEDLFAEAFSRFKVLNSANRSWALHFLSCWADRCVLQPDLPRAPVLNSDRDLTPWRYFSTDSLLHNLYTKLSLSADTTDKGHGRAPLLALWAALSHGSKEKRPGYAANPSAIEGFYPTNIPAIVEYLLSKAILSKTDLAISKLIILELYRTHPAITCSLLVRKLKASTILDDFKHWSGGSKSTVNSTMLTGIGLGVSQFESVGKFAKETASFYAHGLGGLFVNSSSGDGVSGTSSGSGSGTSIPVKPLALHHAKHGLVRENSLSHASAAAHMASLSAAAAAELHVFEDVPILDATTANTLWGSVIGKKSVQTKHSPHAMMRDAAVSVLSDLLIEDVRPALPYLAVIFNYALLKFDHQTAHLLYSAFVPIRTLLKDSDRKRAKDLIRTNGILDTLITLLKHSTFKLNWMCESLSATASPSSGHVSVIAAPAAAATVMIGLPSSNSSHQLAPPSPLAPSLSRHISGTASIAAYQATQAPAQPFAVENALGPNLLAWAAAIKPGYLVNIICQCASLLYETTTKMDWANELVEWIVQSVDSSFTDVSASTKALELCRAVLETSELHKDWSKNASEPNSPRESGEFKRNQNGETAPADEDGSGTAGIFCEEDSDLLRVPPTIISGLQGAFLETLLFFDRALRTSQHSSWIASASLREKLRHQEHITTLRARTEDMLSLLTTAVPHLDRSSSLIDVLFVGISMLRINPIGFPALFEKGLLLVEHVLSDPRFSQAMSNSSASDKEALVSSDPKSKDESPTASLNAAAAALGSRLRRHLKGANVWDFPGLLPLALRGWYCQRTERAGASLLSALLDCPNLPLTSPQLDSAHTNNPGKRFYSHTAEGEGMIPHWLNPVLALIGLLPWLHYSITSLNARKDDEYTASVSETCQALCSVIERACDRETVLGGQVDIVPAALMPIRNLLAALANRQTNYGGYYDRAGEASRFVQDVLKRLILLQNLYSLLCVSVGDLLAQIAVEAPAKLSESILFVHEAFRSSAIPYLQEKPAAHFRTLDVRACPRFTTEAIGAIYKHMFEVERNPIVTEASFRIGGTPSNDAQARSSVLSIMNALYAYPSGWPSSLIEHPDLGLESPRARRNSTASTASEDPNGDETGSNIPEPIVHPLTRTSQFNAKLELTHQGGLKAAIDALHSTIIKPKGSKKKSKASPVPSVVISGGGKDSTLTARGSKKKVKGHEKTKTEVGKSSKKDAPTSGRRSSKAPDVESPLPSPTSNSKPSKEPTSSTSSSKSKNSSNIQIHFERATGAGTLKGRPNAITDSPHQQHFRQHMKKKSEEDEEISSIVDEVLGEMDDEMSLYIQQLHTIEEMEFLKSVLMDDDTDLETLLSTPVGAADDDSEDSDSDDGSDSDDDDSDDGLRDEFLKQFNLDGINLAAFASPRSPGNSARDDEADSAPSSARSSNMDSARSSTALSPRSAKAGGVSPTGAPPLSARRKPSSRLGHSRTGSGDSNGESAVPSIGLDIGNFEIDELSRALAGLNSYQPDTISEDENESASQTTDAESEFDDDEASSSSSSSEDDEDRAVLQRERSGTPASRRTSSRRPRIKKQTSVSSATALAPEDAESEGSAGLESSDDRIQRKETLRKEKRMSAGPIISAHPARERKAFKKRSNPGSASDGAIAVTTVSPSPPSSMKLPSDVEGDAEGGDMEDLAAAAQKAKALKKAKRKSSKADGSPPTDRSGAATMRPSTRSASPPVVPVVSSIPARTSPPSSKHSRTPSLPSKSIGITSTYGGSGTSAPSSSGALGASSSSSGGTSKAPSSTLSRRLHGRGASNEVSLAGMRKVIDDPDSLGKFLNWMKHNNLDSDVLQLVVAVKEYRQLKDADALKLAAKRIIDTYFKPKRGLATLTETLRADTYNAFAALENKVPPPNLFDPAETYCVDHLTKNHYVMFTKSPFYA